MNDHHKNVYHSLLIVILITISAASLFAAFHYRNAVVSKNKAYMGTSDLPVYHNANYALNRIRREPKAYDHVTVFIGSSLFQRWDFRRCFPDKPFINRGIGGETSNDLLNRFDQDVVSLKPERAIIYISTNDVRSGLPPEKTIGNLQAMLARCRQSDIDPAVLTLAPVRYDINPSLKLSHSIKDIEQLHRRLVSYCLEKKIPFLDTYGWLSSASKKNEEIFIKDGLHLNEIGYDRLSRWLLPRIGNDKDNQ